MHGTLISCHSKDLYFRANIEKRSHFFQRLDVDPNFTTMRRLRPDPSGDVNLNGVVDGMDFLDIHHHMGRVIGDAQWTDRVDINHDGVIDDADMTDFLTQFRTQN